LNPHVIYVVGWGRSGSTLLGAMLARRLGGIAVGELERVWELGFRKNHRCSCGLAFRDCSFWVEVTKEARLCSSDAADLERLIREWTRWRKVPRLLTMNNEKTPRSLLEAVEVLRCLYVAVHRVCAGVPIVDSSKSPLYAWLLQREQSIRWDFVHLIRDSRAVAFSHQRTRRDPSSTEDRFMRKSGPVKSAAEWDLRNTLAAALAKSSRGYVRVRYEELALQPAVEIEHLTQWLGLEGGAAKAKETVEYQGQHMLGGNPVRFARGESEVRADEAWRTGMPKSRRWMVTCLSAPWLLAFGYPVVGRRLWRTP
jgi:hypothetical protein